MNKIELKPCPFCGCEEIATEICYPSRVFRIYCMGSDHACLAEMHFNFEDAGITGGIIELSRVNSIMNELIENWNMRVSDDNE